VALSAVEAFLGRITDPEAASARITGGDPAHRTIMFTDMVHSTEMTARLGDVAATELVRAHDSIVRRALARHRGREVKHLGDGIMASFDSTPSAVDCAMTIQTSFDTYNRSSSEPIHVRIGEDCGEPVEDSHDLFGSTVQRASRICGVAEGDQILVSHRVRDECRDGYFFADRGYRNLKGFQQQVQVFECCWRDETSR
jgi:class 3 adenylate cyclase